MTFESEGLLIVAFYIWLPPASYVVFSDNSGYKMFYGRAYPNFWENEIKIKVINFSFIFIFPSTCHRQHVNKIKLSTILSKLNFQNTLFHCKNVKQLFIYKKIAVY